MRGHCFSEHGVDPEPESWESLRAAEKEAAGWECRLCNEPSAVVGRLHVHHLIPRRYFDAEEDSHFRENLAAVCASCHKTLEETNDRCPKCDYEISSVGSLEPKIEEEVQAVGEPLPYKTLGYQCPGCRAVADFRDWINTNFNSA
jgi:uncharacterized protein with PIN domain